MPVPTNLTRRTTLRNLIAAAALLGAGLAAGHAATVTASPPEAILWGYPGAVFTIRPGDDCKVNGKNICAIKVERTNGNGRTVSFKDKRS